MEKIFLSLGSTKTLPNMGFFSSLKRLFFAGESVAKSAANKTKEAVKDGANDLVDKASDMAKEASEVVADKTSGLRESILDGTEGVLDKSKDLLGDLKDKANDIMEDVSSGEIGQTIDALDKAKDTGEAWFEGGKEAAKNTADAVVDAGEKVSKPLSEKVGDALKNVDQKAGELLDKGKEVASDLYDKAADNEVVKSAGEVSESVGREVLDAKDALVDKAKDVSESIGSKVLAAGATGAAMAGSASESIGAKVNEAKDVLVERAKEVTADLGEKLDETIEKAEKMAAEEAATPKKKFADDTLTTGDSLLEGKDDFFAKAAQFADGDYNAFDDSTPKIVEPTERPAGMLELPNDDGTRKSESGTAGFTDTDGDGDDLIDDAIVDGEE